MTSKFMTDPIRILVKRDELTLEGIKQFFVAVEREEWEVIGWTEKMRSNNFNSIINARRYASEGKRCNYG
ncbi:hypothetical protein V6N11_028127 [Hibiscus sabdariffa]|uniref:Uncharacterized protein n=1 Tax=Hibiscus sabdariffa TaxID=183260 RepID=A0ABR2P079_9ROSI